MTNTTTTQPTPIETAWQKLQDAHQVVQVPLNEPQRALDWMLIITTLLPILLEMMANCSKTRSQRGLFDFLFNRGVNRSLQIKALVSSAMMPVDRKLDLSARDFIAYSEAIGDTIDGFTNDELRDVVHLATDIHGSSGGLTHSWST